MPLQASETCGVSGARTPKSLKKSRAARAKDSHLVDYVIGVGALPNNGKVKTQGCQNDALDNVTFFGRHGPKK